MSLKAVNHFTGNLSCETIAIYLLAANAACLLKLISKLLGNIIDTPQFGQKT